MPGFKMKLQREIKDKSLFPTCKQVHILVAVAALDALRLESTTWNFSHACILGNSQVMSLANQHAID